MPFDPATAFSFADPAGSDGIDDWFVPGQTPNPTDQPDDWYVPMRAAAASMVPPAQSPQLNAANPRISNQSAAPPDPFAAYWSMIPASRVGAMAWAPPIFPNSFGQFPSAAPAPRFRRNLWIGCSRLLRIRHEAIRPPLKIILF